MSNFIQNIRLGHANNSSSSHSLVWIAEPNERDYLEMEEAISALDFAPDDFGWSNFTLTSAHDKATYFMSQYWRSLDRLDFLSHGQKLAAFKALFGRSSSREDLEVPYVDHQSAWMPIPASLVGDLWDRVVNNPHVAILGGNDNSDGHPLEEVYPSYPMTRLLEGGLEELGTMFGVLEHSEEVEGVPSYRFSRTWSGHMRQDRDHLIYFKKDTGGKTRVWWPQNPHSPPVEYDKASVPELVDLKVTDMCPYGCSYCYQGSTPEGQHASWDAVDAIMKELVRVGVMEVAVGGGEPTLWPHMGKLLKKYGQEINVNFTTYNTKWLEGNDDIKAYTRSVAFSCLSDAALEKIVKHKYGGFTLHLVEGVHSLQDILSVAEKVKKLCETHNRAEKMKNITFTLLGSKRTHRGASLDPAKTLDLKELSRATWADGNLKHFCLSVDTALLQNHPEDVRNLFDHRLYHEKEGKYSCYIDAVTSKIGPSSYDLDSLVPFLHDSWLEEYAGF